MAVRIVLADDHVIVRQGIRSLLEKEAYEVVGEASNGTDAVRLVTELAPDVAVLDISMPVLSGIEASRQIRAAAPATAVILLSMLSEEPYLLDALRSGVSGYVLKTHATEDLVQALTEVLRGNTFLTPVLSRSVLDSFRASPVAPPSTLSAREQEVLRLIAEGQSNKQIAFTLGIGVKTVETYRTRLMEKLDIRETAGLVRYAIRIGLIAPAVMVLVLSPIALSGC